MAVHAIVHAARTQDECWQLIWRQFWFDGRSNIDLKDKHRTLVQNGRAVNKRQGHVRQRYT